MTLGEKQEVFTSNIGKLITYAETLGYGCRLREVERTAYQQAEYVRNKRSLTNDSKHLESLAADIYFTQAGKLLDKKSDLEIFGKYWESLNSANKWGGNWKSLVDCPHFEMSKE